MRQKKLTFVTLDLLKSKGVIIEPQQLNLPKNKKIHLEIGSGKGQFITSLAHDNKDDFFIAFEINMSVIYRIVEKKEALNLDNLFIIFDDGKHLEQYLTFESIDYIYLNFSDPWPKKKHHKRRLTAPSFLALYAHALKKDGILQFRTDVLPFFEDSLETIAKVFNIFDVTYQLEPSLYMTEYEEKKRLISTINQVKGQKKHA
ncbi:MAG: tRNA (guanosine(46)-N7)-methyltransferase TrmB [Acholeplasmataceae bacterium]